MKRLLVLVIVFGLVGAACGGGDDDSPLPAADAATGGDESGGDESGGDESGGDESGGDESGGDEAGGDEAGASAPEMVSIRSLGIDLPPEIVWDVPVPADSEFDGTAEIADQSIVFVISDADPDSLVPAMDDFFDATFESPVIDPDFDAWQGTEPSEAGLRGVNVGFQRCADDTCGWNVRIEVAGFEVAS